MKSLVSTSVIVDHPGGLTREELLDFYVKHLFAASDEFVRCETTRVEELDEPDFIQNEPVMKYVRIDTLTLP